MHIAVEGCCHGELDKIYETMQFMEKRDGIKIELLLCCGDFQAVRDEADLHCMAVPDKYKSMQSFWQYYNGIKTAPYLTLFIGGNHEASNHLQELPYGGWVAPNIFYMGYSNVVTYKGLRIGGISGIFKGHDYNKGHFERPPYDNGTKRSVYHVRSVEVFRLKLVERPVDIMMSHDWPNGIVHFGNIPELLRRKPYFEEDILRNRLGSPPLMELLNHVKPTYWFSGHLHVKFPATVNHDNPTSGDQNSPKITNFLALDKCLPRREFLQVIDVKTPENCSNQGLSYDPEWLGILQSTNDLVSISRRFVYLPHNIDGSFSKYQATPDRVEKIKSIFGGDLTIPENFKRDIAPLYDPEKFNWYKPVQCKTSHQTSEFCTKLGLNDPLTMVVTAEGGNLSSSFNNSSVLCEEDDEMPSTIASSTSINEDEIDLGSDDEDDDANEKNGGVSTAEAEISISVSSSKETEINKDPQRKPESPIPSSSLSSDDESDQKTSSGSETRGIMRLSLHLPDPVFGATSTPVRLPNISKTGDKKTQDFIPLNPSADSDSNTSSSETNKSAVTVAKNALLLSLRGKRVSDTESDLSESSSGNTSGVAKKFKRRNASFYTSQSDEETS